MSRQDKIALVLLFAVCYAASWFSPVIVSAEHYSGPQVLASAAQLFTRVQTPVDLIHLAALLVALSANAIPIAMVATWNAPADRRWGHVMGTWLVAALISVIVVGAIEFPAPSLGFLAWLVGVGGLGVVSIVRRSPRTGVRRAAATAPLTLYPRVQRMALDALGLRRALTLDPAGGTARELAAEWVMAIDGLGGPALRALHNRGIDIERVRDRVDALQRRPTGALRDAARHADDALRTLVAAIIPRRGAAQS
ncbi:MAG: hypothetical protein AAF721_05200 [Myxococcota bacterium]